VLNRRPIAVVSVSETKLPTGDTLDLDGTGSSDPDGSVKEHTWIFGDGSLAYGPRVNHVYEDNGIFMVVLTVTDNNGGTDSTSIFIQVENRAPIPAISVAEQSLTLVPVKFLAEEAVDPDGEIVGYFWDFGDGSGSSGPNVTHTYGSSGVYTVRLTVMDNDGRTDSTNSTVNVLNRPPEAEARVVNTELVNNTVRFDAVDSFDADGIINAWLWDFGDGSTGEGREAYHKYTEPGTYTWNLTVVDDRGDEQYMDGQILINPRPYVPGDQEPGTTSDDDTPGPGALMAIIALSIAAMVVATARRRK
jgi:PKD repeat protein